MQASNAGDTFDYVIVGAGAAGCALANKLSEDPGVTICLLEAGPPDRNLMIHIPAGFTKILGNPNYTWQFDTEPTAQTGDRAVPIVQGRTLGGSTSVNGMIYVRGQAADFDGWEAAGNPGWSYARLLPYFKALETRLFGDPEFRGDSGPVNVTEIAWRDPACRAFVEAAVENFIPINKDYNGRTQQGVAYTQTTIANRRRVSAARALLRPAVQRGNVRVITDAVADLVLFKDKRAVGVRYAQGEQPKTVRARREVIISAGTVNTARLLQISGIGDPDWLAPLGVPVVSARAGVGRNLRDHYMCSVVAAGQDFRSINQLAQGIPLWGQVLRYMAGAQSILNLCPPLIHWFMKSAAAVGDADIQGVFSPASNNIGQSGKLESTPGMTLAFWQHRPESSGYVRAVSTRIADAPIVQPNYLQHETDRTAMLAALRMARKLLQSRALSPLVKAETAPGPDIQSDADLLAYAGRAGGTAYHLVGTARMGREDDPTTVVSPELRVHGVEALRVVDASIMPRQISGNTQAATMTIGLKAADMIRNMASSSNLSAA